MGADRLGVYRRARRRRHGVTVLPAPAQVCVLAKLFCAGIAEIARLRRHFDGQVV
jgi:hypothetical protein